MGEESTVPTWWSSIQLLALSVLLFVLAAVIRRDGSKATRGLRAMGAVFLYFSLDEVATLHESITGVLERFEAVPRFAGEHGIWIWVHGLIGLAIPAWVLPGLIPRARAKPREAIWFAVGGGLMVLGGVVVEVTSYFVGYLVLIEETLEIVGASLMLWATYRLLENTPVVFSADPSHA